MIKTVEEGLEIFKKDLKNYVSEQKRFNEKYGEEGIWAWTEEAGELRTRISRLIGMWGILDLNKEERKSIKEDIERELCLNEEERKSIKEDIEMVLGLRERVSLKEQRERVLARLEKA